MARPPQENSVFQGRRFKSDVQDCYTNPKSLFSKKLVQRLALSICSCTPMRKIHPAMKLLFLKKIDITSLQKIGCGLLQISVLRKKERGTFSTQNQSDEDTLLTARWVLVLRRKLFLWVQHSQEKQLDFLHHFASSISNSFIIVP